MGSWAHGWAAVLILTAQVTAISPAANSQAPSWQPIAFHQLPGWKKQQHDKALSAFKRSCHLLQPKGLVAVKAARWQGICRESKTFPDTGDARRFFERHFQPYLWQDSPANTTGQPGLVTGYYVPELHGSYHKEGRFQWPIYRVPEDFDTPYLTRREIEEGALAGKGLELVWLDDPVMRFFLHVQGSGFVRLPDGSRKKLQFAAKNGLPYRSIGKYLLNKNKLAPGQVSLQTIRQYLYDHPQEQSSVFNHNPSYIFFSLEEADTMPKGAAGVPLTPHHSLAIDPDILPYGLPVYLADVESQQQEFLLITQDTGSAIKGPRRADIFMGLGKQAEELAGTLASPARWYVLLPRHE